MQKNKKEKAKDFHENLSKKFKKRKLCKGNREHDWLLTLPEYETRGVNITPEMIPAYYELKEEEKEFEDRMDKKYEKIGIRRGLSFRRYSLRKITKYYICSVCGKRDYK